MKKLLLILLLPFTIKAQVPEKMSYQAVIRDGLDNLLSQQTVSMRISIIQGSPSGNAMYVEAHTGTTNANGLLSIEIGSGIVTSGSFSDIDWANGPFFLKTETDPSGGVNYTITSINQLLSVPYALYAKESGSSIPGPQGPQGEIGPQGPPGIGTNLPQGNTINQMMYWDGDTWEVVNPGSNGQVLTLCNGTLTWTTGGICDSRIDSLICTGVTTNVTWEVGQYQEVNIDIPYTGGNGGVYSAHSISSSGILGLIASSNQGIFANGYGTRTYIISGTPDSIGTAYFDININGVGCILELIILENPTINCGAFTAPGVWKEFMCHNLGANTNADPFLPSWELVGDYYQWGKVIPSAPGPSGPSPDETNGLEIPTWNLGGGVSFNSWLPDVKTINDPCPNGYKVPTYSNWSNIIENGLNTIEYIGTWANAWSNYSSGVKIGNIFLPATGYRYDLNGILSNRGLLGTYWTSTVVAVPSAYFLGIFDGNVNLQGRPIAYGHSIRCIAE
jgi:uncharacterized protein (TIGR02145 family)